MDIKKRIDNYLGISKVNPVVIKEEPQVVKEETVIEEKPVRKLKKLSIPRSRRTH